jgi:hypothetical protein
MKMTDLQRKLDPRRASGASGKFIAIMARLLDIEPITNPAINEIAITSDGFLILDGSFEGTYSDFIRNIKDWCNAVKLTPAEKFEFGMMIQKNTMNYMPKPGKLNTAA